MSPRFGQRKPGGSNDTLEFPATNYMANALTGKAAEKKAWRRITSLAYLKLQISERFTKAKEAWHKDPRHHETEVNPTSPTKEVLPGPSSGLDRPHSRTDPYRTLAVCILPQEGSASDKTISAGFAIYLRGCFAATSPSTSSIPAFLRPKWRRGRVWIPESEDPRSEERRVGKECW